jgi:hypothetical protein
MNEEDAFRIVDNCSLLEVILGKRALLYAVDVLNMIDPGKIALSYVNFSLLEVVYDSSLPNKFVLYDEHDDKVDSFDVPRDFLFATVVSEELVRNHKLLQLEFSDD